MKKMINKYFTRKFNTRRGVKFAILLKRPYDWIRIHISGDIILKQAYGINYTIGGPKSYYSIINLIWTKNMLRDLNNFVQEDINATLENVLVNELKENDRG